MDNTFLGLPLGFVWFPILIGLGIGAFFPLRPFMRSKLHFTIRPNDECKLRKDADTLSKIITGKSNNDLIGFCNILRKLGLTLFVK
jgi:hypothetical protein